MLLRISGLSAFALFAFITSGAFAAEPPTEQSSETNIGSGIAVTTVDLANWFYTSTAAPGALGSEYPGDASAMGNILIDDDADGSGSDLELVTGDLIDGPTYNGFNSSQESIQSWISPFGMIPYEEDVTFRLSYSIRESSPTPVPGLLLIGRVRWGHGTFGNMGSGNNWIRPQVNRPHPDNTTYHVMFDTLDIASANNPTIGDANVQENDITLFFDGFDLFNSHNGAIELESVVIDKINKSTIIANQTLLNEVSDFTTDTTQFVSTRSTVSGSVVRTVDSAVLTTEAGGVSDGSITLFGNLDVNLVGAELSLPILNVPAVSGLIYRAEYDVTTSNSAANPIPLVVMRTRTVEYLYARDTTETQIRPLRENGTVNPAFITGGTYSAYHHFPDDYVADGVSGSMVKYGDGITTTISLQDESSPIATRGGSITVTGIRLYTIPESILP